MADKPPHRPGALKQQNKIHKHGKHKSKGAIDTENKGRIGAKQLSKKKKHDLQRHERRHRAKQIRQRKRDEVLSHKRKLGGNSSAPFLVALIPLHWTYHKSENKLPQQIADWVTSVVNDAHVTVSSSGNIHVSIPRFKQRFTIVMPHHDDLYATLDVCKVATNVAFLVDHQDGIDEESEVMLAAIIAQGLPTATVVTSNVIDISRSYNSSFKMQKSSRKFVQKSIDKFLPTTKVCTLDQPNDALLLLRKIGSEKQRPVAMRDRRCHMFAEKVETVENRVGSYTLKVTGYVRGQPLNVNGLVHIPGWGDFQMSEISLPEDPHKMEKKYSNLGDMEDMEEEEAQVIDRVDTNLQVSLQSENIPDPLDAEQTWPDEDEMEEAEKWNMITKRVPKGTSQYQAAWILESDDESNSLSSDEESHDMGMDSEDKMAAESGSECETADDASQQDDDDYETVTEGDGDKYDNKLDMDEEEETLAKIKAAREDQLFPDEVDTPLDIPAKIRFQRYRGLKSYRTSLWDAKESLPTDYGRIFQFQNFNRTRKQVLKDVHDGALPGWYVTVNIDCVPCELIKEWQLNPHKPMVIYQLLPHENKMSVLHFVLKRCNTGQQLPIKSKEQLIFQCGYRRFYAQPIFSQHTYGNKQKYERFFQPDSTVVATVFAPIMYPPASVLVYKETRDQMFGISMELVATGSLLSVNPDRVVTKRVVLSGHPLKIHKRTSVVRYMFFSRNDISWFKPVELRTKLGKRGHIKEPLGTHGHMKCSFNGQLKSQDVVLMNLYKRIFPKWTYDGHVLDVIVERIKDEIEKKRENDVLDAIFT